ncbi:MAG: nucleotide exchange factor GrpE [bacterium]|nr:nucleotide exchange factor GrpE [bacterium]
MKRRQEEKSQQIQEQRADKPKEEEAGPHPVRPAESLAEEESEAIAQQKEAIREEEAAARKQIDELDQMVASLRQQLQEMEDRWKRAAADLDNYRKRFDRELERLRFAERDFVLHEWLAVVDNMERALRAAENASDNPWYQGMQAIYQQMHSILHKFRVTPINPKGEFFDPQRHEAVATVDLEDQPEGIIAEVVEPGYIICDRILRPAKVIPVRHQAKK